MENEAYFEYMKKKPFKEKLIEFAQACERYKESSINSSLNRGDVEWERKESTAQALRMEFLFQELIKDYENKGEN